MGMQLRGWLIKNGHRRKVVGEVKSISWGGAQTKGEVHKRELTKQDVLAQ